MVDDVPAGWLASRIVFSVLWHAGLFVPFLEPGRSAAPAWDDDAPQWRLRNAAVVDGGATQSVSSQRLIE